MASQNENQVANDAANLIGSHAYYYMIECVTTALSYGVTLSLFYASLRASAERREGTPKARNFLLGLTCFMFLMNTGLFVSMISTNLMVFSWARDAVTENTPPIQERLSAAYVTTIPFTVCSSLFEVVNFTVGDAIVIWRAVALWPRSQLVRGGLYVLLLGEIGMSLGTLIEFSTAMVGSNGTDLTSWLAANSARILVSLGVNVGATLCISVKAWKFRRTLKLSFSQATTRKSLVNQVLKLLVECGLIFCILQLIYAIFNLVILPIADKKPFMDPLCLFQAAVAPFFALYAGMYPPLVIIVMAKQRSVFGTSTFVSCSHDTPARHVAERHESRVLSALHFATVPETTGQTDSYSESHSIGERLKGSLKDGGHIAIVPDDEKV